MLARIKEPFSDEELHADISFLEQLHVGCCARAKIGRAADEETDELAPPHMERGGGLGYGPEVGTSGTSSVKLVP